MKAYKHYSFDLWLTLIKSNPVFKREKAKYFFDHFNRDKKTLEEVEAIIRDIDIMCTRINERVCENIDTFEMYAIILHRLNYDYTSFQYRDFVSIYNVLNAKLKEYMPTVYDSDTISTLCELKNNGCTLSILSNTGFIKGHTLRQILDYIGIGYLFSFQIYSDEVGISKPDPTIFSNMVSRVFSVRLSNPITKNDIIHVGDNKLADGEGADQFGINYAIINSNEYSIKNLL